MFCPKCTTTIEDYSKLEGGWCPKCEEWYPLDILQDAMDEEFPEYEDDETGENFFPSEDIIAVKKQTVVMDNI